MKIVDVTLAQARVLKTYSERNDSPLKDACFLWDASWLQNSNDHRKKIDDILTQLKQDNIFSIVYRIMSDGNDEVEDECINLFYGISKMSEASLSFPWLQPVNVEVDSNMDVDNSSSSSSSKPKHNENENLIKQLFASYNKENGNGNGNEGMVIYISGDRSSVGKSTCCMSLLASLVNNGISPDDLGYIKPVTQCEAEQPVVRYCNKVGIECIGIGPVVFYKGFTRAYLNNTTDTSEVLLMQAIHSVNKIKLNKKFVLIDGVGYPAVGSICGISNADVAKKINAPVLLIGKSGVGDAVDSHNLNSAFFQLKGCHVLGGIFNKLALNGFYNIISCKEAIDIYFQQHGNGQKAYGYLPLVAAAEPTDATAEVDVDVDKVPNDIVKMFMEHVDVEALVFDVFRHCVEIDKGKDVLTDMNVGVGVGVDIVVAKSGSIPNTIAMNMDVVAPEKNANTTSQANSISNSSSNNRKRSRSEIEQLAQKQGAKGG